MARTLIATVKASKNKATNPLTWTAADATNNHYYVDAGDTILLMKNTDSAPKTVTVSSVAEPNYGRTGDQVIVVPAATGTDPGTAAFGLPSPEAWRQAGTSNINVNVSAATGLFLTALQVERR